MKIKEGETWTVDTRGGKNLTVSLLEDVDTSKDEFFEAAIIKGRRHYISHFRPSDGPGDTITMRTTLTIFKNRR